MKGVYSIAEAVDAVHNGKIVIFNVIPNGFTDAQINSFKAVIKLLNSRGATAMLESDLKVSADIINTMVEARKGMIHFQKEYWFIQTEGSPDIEPI